MIKAVFIDIDETLVNSNREVTPKTMQEIKRCVQKGIKIILASGRSRKEAIEYQKEIGASPYIISSPASPAPFAVPVTGFTSNNVGCVNMNGLLIAFLYQSIPNFGTLGGVKLNEPLIEMCGSFNL